MSETIILNIKSSLYHQLFKKSSETGESISVMINEAIELFLAECSTDIEAFTQRQHEPTISLDELKGELNRT
jgi:hypothetical protein